MPEMASPHFSREELRCKDCLAYVISQELLDALEQLRALGPEPISVHDAYRCPEHNKSVGGVSASQHTAGKAADVSVRGLSLQEMYDRAKQVPEFAEGGIGVYPGPSPFIHCDVRGVKARWARVNGAYVGTAGIVEG